MGKASLKKLNIKSLAFSSSNQSCSGRKSHISKLLSFVPNERLAYKLEDRLLNFGESTLRKYYTRLWLGLLIFPAQLAREHFAVANKKRKLNH